MDADISRRRILTVGKCPPAIAQGRSGENVTGENPHVWHPGTQRAFGTSRLLGSA